MRAKSFASGPKRTTTMEINGEIFVILGAIILMIALLVADCAVAAAVTAASGIIPVLAVRRVRPVRIIRAKE